MRHLYTLQGTEETEINNTHPLSLRVLISVEELAKRNHYYTLVSTMRKIHKGEQESQIMHTTQLEVSHQERFPREGALERIP